MATYICMLRGINVLGHNQVKMRDLEALFRALGCDGVRTYIQSGNVVFGAQRTSVPKLARRIEKKLLEECGLSVSSFVTTPRELGTVIRRNPFLKDRRIEQAKLHVTFLSQAPKKQALKGLEGRPRPPEAFHCLGKAMYLYCPHGYGRTKLSNNILERVLSVTATTRNWRTVNRLADMANSR